MSKPVLHQVSVGATIGDAITDQAFMLRRWLREMGFVSEIFAEHIHPELEGEVRPIATYRPRPNERLVIYHHSIGSPTADLLMDLPVQLLLIYHNITPPEFFASIDPELTRQMVVGRQQLERLCRHTVLACGVSAYNEAELRAVGFGRTSVLPLALNESEYRVAPDPLVMSRNPKQGPCLLFVGRSVPNKRQEDLIKLLYFYRRIEQSARLVIVGSDWMPAYSRWLRDLAMDLGMADDVCFTGYVTQQQMVSYYRLADLYVSMSEHEGFGKPFIESMYLGLPILAYAAAGVPDTIGQTGILFREKNYDAVAELIYILMHDKLLRVRIVARQQERVQVFLEPAVRKTWEAIISDLGIGEQAGPTNKQGIS